MTKTTQDIVDRIRAGLADPTAGLPARVEIQRAALAVLSDADLLSTHLLSTPQLAATIAEQLDDDEADAAPPPAFTILPASGDQPPAFMFDIT